MGGRYFEDCNEAVVIDPDAASCFGVAPYALDPDAAARLWQVSTDALTGSRIAAPSAASAQRA